MTDAESVPTLVSDSEMAAPAELRGPARGYEEDLEKHPEWMTLSRLPMRVKVEVPLPRFKVRDLLALACGQVLPSAWSTTADAPLIAGSTPLSWVEFEVVEQRMAVRITRLA